MNCWKRWVFVPFLFLGSCISPKLIEKQLDAMKTTSVKIQKYVDWRKQMYPTIRDGYSQHVYSIGESILIDIIEDQKTQIRSLFDMILPPTTKIQVQIDNKPQSA